MALDIDPDCHAGVDCEGCPFDEYCPQRDGEEKRRQSTGRYRPSAEEIEHSERQGDLIAIFRAEY